MDKPTILVVNPNTSEAMTIAIDRIAWEAAGSSANIVTRRSLQGPHTIEGPLDAALGAAGMLEVVGAYPYSFDAVVVACFGDPGVEALRLLVRVPVHRHWGGIVYAGGISQPALRHCDAQRGHAGALCGGGCGHGDHQPVCRDVSDPLAVADFESGDPSGGRYPGFSRPAGRQRWRGVPAVWLCRHCGTDPRDRGACWGTVHPQCSCRGDPGHCLPASSARPTGGRTVPARQPEAACRALPAWYVTMKGEPKHAYTRQERPHCHCGRCVSG